jgi:hypothetical protein
MEELKTLLDKGVLMEDDFIQTYMSVIKDEGFSQYFMEKEKLAKELLQTLIDESTGHKKTLENIINNL